MFLTIMTIVLILGVVFYVLQPVVSGHSAPLERREDEPSEVEARKRVALLALRDVEYDFATGKLDEDDYRQLRGELATEALDAMRAQEALESLQRPPADVGAGAETDAGAPPASLERDELEAEIARYRAALQSGTACPECRQANPPGSRFCASCGFSLAAAPVAAATRSDSDQG